MLFFACFTILIGIVFKNIIIAIMSSTALYGLVLLMSFAFMNTIYLNPAFHKVNSIKYIPILSLQLHVGSFDLAFIVTLLMHLSATIGLCFLALKKFKRQDL
jgi:hypothetical protein